MSFIPGHHQVPGILAHEYDFQIGFYKIVMVIIRYLHPAIECAHATVKCTHFTTGGYATDKLYRVGIIISVRYFDQQYRSVLSIDMPFKLATAATDAVCF